MVERHVPGWPGYRRRARDSSSTIKATQVKSSATPTSTTRATFSIATIVLTSNRQSSSRCQRLTAPAGHQRRTALCERQPRQGGQTSAIRRPDGPRAGSEPAPVVARPVLRRPVRPREPVARLASRRSSAGAGTLDKARRAGSRVNGSVRTPSAAGDGGSNMGPWLLPLFES